MRTFRYMIALICLLPNLAWADISVSQAWIPEAPPGAQAMGAFMTINNNGDQAVHIIKAHADHFDRVELHQSIEVNGMHQMIAQESLTVPAHGQLQLKPGSYHIMLIGIQQPYHAGDHVLIELTLDNGQHIQVNTPIYQRKHPMMHQPMH